MKKSLNSVYIFSIDVCVWSYYLCFVVTKTTLYSFFYRKKRETHPYIHLNITFVLLMFFPFLISRWHMCVSLYKFLFRQNKYIWRSLSLKIIKCYLICNIIKAAKKQPFHIQQHATTTTQSTHNHINSFLSLFKVILIYLIIINYLKLFAVVPTLFSAVAILCSVVLLPTVIKDSVLIIIMRYFNISPCSPYTYSILWIYGIYESSSACMSIRLFRLA